MYKIEELKGKILLAASTLGMDINLDGTDMPSVDLCALKRELIEGFKIDPVVATFVTNTLKDGVDFNWLDMYDDKRSLYQINLGIIQGIDMSFSKKYVYTSLQLEAIRQWAKRGVDMKDISFCTLPHKNIRALAALKQSGCDYIPFVCSHYSPGYLRNYLEVYKMIGHIEEKEIFLRVENVLNAKALIQNGIDLMKLKLIGFFEADEEVQTRVLCQIGIAIKRGRLCKLRSLFENIEMFSLHDLLMINNLFNLNNLENLKAEKINSSTLVFKSLGIHNAKGDPAIYDKFFEKDASYYDDSRKMNCIKFGLDITPFLKDSIDSNVMHYICNIANHMMDADYGVIQITDAFKVFEKAIDCLDNANLVFSRLSNLTSSLSNFDYLDFSVLLDQTVPDELKIEAILAKHLGCDVETVRNKNLSYFTQSRLLEKELHEDAKEIFLKKQKIDNVIDELNSAAYVIDVSKLDIEALGPSNVEVLAHFSHLKDKPGFYELAHLNFFGKVVFLGIDALELGLDILPIIKHLNGYYAENMLQMMIEEHLNTSDYISHSESEYKASNDSDMFPF